MRPLLELGLAILLFFLQSELLVSLMLIHSKSTCCDPPSFFHNSIDIFLSESKFLFCIPEVIPGASRLSNVSAIRTRVDPCAGEWLYCSDRQRKPERGKSEDASPPPAQPEG